MKKITFISALLLLPVISNAQGLQSYLTGIPIFLSNVIIPFLLGIAFLFFTVNVIRFFVIGSTSEDGRENSKNLAIYSVMAFVIILIFWGVVNIFASATGLSGGSAPVSDYEVNFNGEAGASRPLPATAPAPATTPPPATTASCNCTDIGNGTEQCTRTIGLSTPREPGESCTAIQSTNNSDRQRCTRTQPLGSGPTTWCWLR